MNGQLEQIRDLLARSQSDPDLARALLERPASELARLGMSVPGADDDAAAENMALVAPKAHQMLRAAAARRDADAPATDQNLTVDKCTACQWAVGASIAGLLVALTAASGGAILATEPVVVALAAKLSADANLIAAALNGLIATGSSFSAASLGYAICAKIGYCEE